MKSKQNSIYRNYIKRLIDIVLSFLALIVLAPILIIVAVFVRFNLGSPVLFKQERPGLNGKVFTMYKFRSMTDARDENGEFLPNDVRMTGFGKLLRASSLDELPELFNIFIGDMSIVGPRPLLVKYLDLYNDHQKKRHDVRPGLTGLAQASGRNSISWHEKFDLDVEYIENVSMVLDIKIIFMTIQKVFAKEGIEFTQNKTIYETLAENDLDNERKE